MRKSAYISFAGVFGSALMWLLSFKIVAYWLGPEGVGFFSQLRQIVQAATIGATLGGTNAVVQGLSAKTGDSERYHFRRVASRVVGLLGLLITLCVLVFAPQLALLLLSSADISVVSTLRWLAAAILLSAGATYLIAVLNGYRHFRFLAIAQLAGPVLLVVTLVGLHFSGLVFHPRMFAWAFTLCFGASFLVAAWGVLRLPRAQPDMPVGSAKFQLWSFINFGLSVLVAALSSTMAMLLIRSWIIKSEGLAFSGMFDAGWTLTFNYATLFLTAFSTIYLPNLAGAKGKDEQSACMFKAAYLALAGCVAFCYFLVAFREQIVPLFYSHQFASSGGLLVILSIAVLFRSVSWVYGVIMVASRSSRMLVVSEIVYNLTLLLLVWLALEYSSTLASLGWAFVVSNFLYFVFVVEYARHKNGLMDRWRIWPLVILFALPLIIVAVDGGEYLSGSMSHDLLFLLLGLLLCGGALSAYKKVGI